MMMCDASVHPHIRRVSTCFCHQSTAPTPVSPLHTPYTHTHTHPASPRTPHPTMWRQLTALVLLAVPILASAAAYIDITVPVSASMPVFMSAMGLPKNWRSQHQSISEGDVCNQSTFMLDAHTGTHVDAPRHFIDREEGIEALDLDVLIGKTLVVEFPEGTNITGEALKKLQLPPEAERVLFKTDNTAKGLMHTTAFASNYTSFDSTGAAFITKHTKVKLVGIDYLSIGCLEDVVETHRVLLGNGVIAVEGLDLTGVKPGWYQQLCLPAKMKGSDGAPIRCLLQPLSDKQQHTEL